MNQPPRSVRSDAPLLEMQSISKHFGGVMAVAGVSLHLEAGEALAIVGDNGAGKSTLIKVLTGVHVLDEGDIRMEGRPVSITNKRQSRQLGIEAVYQDLGLVDSLDAAGNVFLGHELKRRVLGLNFLDNDRMAREAARVLKEEVGIELEDIHVATHHLSGGERQAVAIARAIYATDLKILVMDEPTAALGPEETRNTLMLMQNLKTTGNRAHRHQPQPRSCLPGRRPGHGDALRSRGRDPGPPDRDQAGRPCPHRRCSGHGGGLTGVPPHAGTRSHVRLRPAWRPSSPRPHARPDQGVMGPAQRLSPTSRAAARRYISR